MYRLYQNCCKNHLCMLSIVSKDKDLKPNWSYFETTTRSASILKASDISPFSGGVCAGSAECLTS